MNIGDIGKLVKFASSPQAQGLIENFMVELDLIKKDRIGFKAAVPLMFRKYDERLDAMDKKLDAMAGLLTDLIRNTNKDGNHVGRTISGTDADGYTVNGKSFGGEPGSSDRGGSDPSG